MGRLGSTQELAEVTGRSLVGSRARTEVIRVTHVVPSLHAVTSVGGSGGTWLSECCWLLESHSCSVAHGGASIYPSLCGSLCPSVSTRNAACTGAMRHLPREMDCSLRAHGSASGQRSLPRGAVAWSKGPRFFHMLTPLSLQPPARTRPAASRGSAWRPSGTTPAPATLVSTDQNVNTVRPHFIHVTVMGLCFLYHLPLCPTQAPRDTDSGLKTLYP